MPQKAAMAKHLRQTKTRTYRNRLRKQAVKNDIREALQAARSGDGETVDAALQSAQKAIDKAVQRGVLHKNTGARRKSRLTARVRVLLAQR